MRTICSRNGSDIYIGRNANSKYFYIQGVSRGNWWHVVFFSSLNIILSKLANLLVFVDSRRNFEKLKPSKKKTKPLSFIYLLSLYFVFIQIEQFSKLIFISLVDEKNCSFSFLEVWQLHDTLYIDTQLCPLHICPVGFTRNSNIWFTGSPTGCL